MKDKKVYYKINLNTKYSKLICLINNRVCIASASWVFLLFYAVYEISLLSFASSEERFCLEKYGDAYREYMSRTPRYMRIPKRRSDLYVLSFALSSNNE